MGIKVLFQLLLVALICSGRLAHAESVIRHQCWLEGIEFILQTNPSTFLAGLDARCQPVILQEARNVNVVSSLQRLTVVRTAISSLTPTPIPPPPTELKALIDRAADSVGIPAKLLTAVIRVESNFINTAISARGAVGLMQIMPSTAKELGISDVSTLLDPAINIQVGARYLAKQLDRFSGRVDLALAAYNAGPQAVIGHGMSIPPYKETMRYVDRVLLLLDHY